MRPVSFLLALLLFFFVSFPRSAQAFWGWEDSHPFLNFDSGYDVNTVTTVSGQVLSVHIDSGRPDVRLEINVDGTRMMVVLGPRRYWDDQGMAVKEGDRVVVCGSKAQGEDGMLSILARTIVEIGQNLEVVLRDEFGRPNWAGGRMGGDAGAGGGGGEGGNGGGHGGGGHGGGGH